MSFVTELSGGMGAMEAVTNWPKMLKAFLIGFSMKAGLYAFPRRHSKTR